MKRGINKTKKHKSNIFVYIIRSLLILFVAAILYNFFLVIFSARTDKEAKYIFGFRAYVITTDSMKPNINVGDIVIIKQIENDDLYENDVITYRLSTEEERVTHRIIDKTEDIYITKGDNNKLEDKSIVRYENIEGKVIFKVPFIGKVFLKLENLFYVFFLTVIILTAYLYNRRLINKSQIRRAKKKQADSLRKEMEEKETIEAIESKESIETIETIKTIEEKNIENDTVNSDIEGLSNQEKEV